MMFVDELVHAFAARGVRQRRPDLKTITTRQTGCSTELRGKRQSPTMPKIDLKQMSVESLVERYAAVGIAQYEAELDDNTRKFNRLVDDLIAIEAELRSRTGDQRTALVPLYKHTNMQVRLKCGPRDPGGRVGRGARN